MACNRRGRMAIVNQTGRGTRAPASGRTITERRRRRRIRIRIGIYGTEERTRIKRAGKSRTSTSRRAGRMTRCGRTRGPNRCSISATRPPAGTTIRNASSLAAITPTSNKLDPFEGTINFLKVDRDLIEKTEFVVFSFFFFLFFASYRLLTFAQRDCSTLRIRTATILDYFRLLSTASVCTHVLARKFLYSSFGSCYRERSFFFLRAFHVRLV